MARDFAVVAGSGSGGCGAGWGRLLPAMDARRSAHRGAAGAGIYEATSYGNAGAGCRMVPGAAWGRERTRMGAETSSFNEPRDLTDARSNISRGIEAHPDDPKWLQLEGRADLLGGKEGAAIEELERARSLR